MEPYDYEGVAQRRWINRHLSPERQSCFADYLFVTGDLTPAQAQQARDDVAAFAVAFGHTLHRRTPTPPRRRRGVIAIRRTRPVRRESHRARPGHRRVKAASAGPPGDSDPAEPPRLRLAPSPAAVYGYGCSRCNECGSVLALDLGRLVCTNYGCGRWGDGS